MNVSIIGFDCCGCTSCFNSCPKKSISMVLDDEGFLYPKINPNTCVNCGICLKKCPIYNFKELNHAFIPISYIGFNNDEEVRINSSSGGIFDIFAKKILSSGGVVYGAAFDSSYSVHHICIQSYERISMLRGSKYVESNLESCFAECREQLNIGKSVLFTGVGCQIAGLNIFLGKKYDNLLTIEVLCHGVPSAKVWKKYLTELDFKKINSISFRDKKYGWKNFSTKIVTDEGTYENCMNKNTYMKIFLGNLSLRPSCYNCKFKVDNMSADITIGDAWGCGKFYPDFDDDKGTSLIIINNQKGLNEFKSIKKSLKFKRINLDDILPKTTESRRPVKQNKNRSKFFKQLDKKSLKRLSFYKCDDKLIVRIIRKVRNILFK